MKIPHQFNLECDCVLLTEKSSFISFPVFFFYFERFVLWFIFVDSEPVILVIFYYFHKTIRKTKTNKESFRQKDIYVSILSVRFLVCVSICYVLKKSINVIFVMEDNEGLQLQLDATQNAKCI